MKNATTYFTVTNNQWSVISHRGITLLLLLFFSPVVFAQFSLSGTVRDAGGSTLPGAAVTIDSTQRGTFTDASGQFRFTNLTRGPVSLRISLLGFESNTKTVQLSDNQAETFLLSRSLTVLDEVVVSATRANQKTAIAYTDLTRRDLVKQNLGQDIPFLLNFTPSVVTTSDAGAGVGYTGIRIRGSDATRVNVTVNGVPYNDAESQGTFWVNMPDFASSVNSIQIQRGVGTSTNGAGSFGGTVNVQTNTLEKQPYAETNLSAGSFNTRKMNVLAGTGLLKNRWVVDARLSKITSDGFIDRAFSNLKSFYVSGGYYTDKSFLRLNIFSGQEQTYQAWNGVPENLLKTNRTFNAFTYDNQTDNYQQDHYQLIGSHELSKRWRLNGALHYTKGHGYYEEFRPEQPLENYGLQPITIRDSVITSTDLVRRQWLDNDFYGGVFSLDYNNFGRLTANIGGGWNRYTGKHYGEIVWAQYASNGNIRHRYYDNDAAKTDFNLYAKAFYQFLPRLNGYVDMQIRTVDYSFLGFDNAARNVQQQANLVFFNPKAGLTYTINDRSLVYASFGVGNKEPNRDDYTQSSAASRPNPETLLDYEAGFKTQTRRLAFSANLYWMQYRNQLVLSGKINEVGNYNRINIPVSYRRGLELEAGWLITKLLHWNVNATISQNRVDNFTEYVDNYDSGGQQAIQHIRTDIAFSPNLIVGSQLLFTPRKGLELALLSKYVGKQYLDNTQDEARKLNGYFVNDLRLIYTLKPRLFNEIAFTVLLNNALNYRYESNGYTFSYVAEGKLSTENYYYPQAGRNVLIGVRVRF